ncbi:hypothetical protein GQ600_7322 [Phytophthora cactorum]|nr:hypothetical protein GQ600_7322 [Phytophthora cactorum]
MEPDTVMTLKPEPLLNRVYRELQERDQVRGVNARLGPVVVFEEITADDFHVHGRTTQAALSSTNSRRKFTRPLQNQLNAIESSLGLTVESQGGRTLEIDGTAYRVDGSLKPEMAEEGTFPTLVLGVAFREECDHLEKK